ncbi:DUF4407 domain-containing protein [Polynucleobacter sp. AP-Capit-er-40B-B4]|uniref:DUF4407 domain-containing protein n=1 Tax=Polynucleobacter sp. AP-Capit-er-40B-B4 TaxID=2576927 RepID=UPI001C0C8177|nr:DUF4407 domain-containing protein [Polynucleobacter sp. AP-Capit-er-40B-B4]MBU3580457.1 DUF4407 domain-containing protein [Polynucleobacter sp. AP-Capit-er-40B-B4]
MAVDNKLKLGDLDDYNYEFGEEAPNDADAFTRLRYWFQNKVEGILYFAAGVDTQLLQNCPHSDRVKEQCIGGTVLATAVLAFLSSSYAFYIVFSPKVSLAIETAKAPIHVFTYIAAIFFGLIWAAMIFNLDRFIVSSTGHGNGKETIDRYEILQAMPRIMMALLIAVVLSKPLEIKIMATEIDSELQDEQKAWIDNTEKEYRHVFDERQKAIETRKSELTKQRDEKKAELTLSDERIVQQQQELQCEIDGTCGSRQKDFGPAAKNKKDRLESLKQISEAKHTSLEPEIKSTQEQLDGLEVELKSLAAERKANRDVLTEQAAKKNGLIKRILVAHEHYFWSGTLLFLLMAFLEIAPILFKMMLRLSPYDYMQENIKLKTLAAKGIDLNEQLDGSADGKDKNIELKDAKYYEADLLKENQVGKLRIEQELTKVAQQEFLERVRVDIKNNPSKYIRQNPLVKDGAVVAGSSEASEWKRIRNSVAECAESLKTENAGKSYNYAISDCMKSIAAMKAISDKNKSD